MLHRTTFLPDSCSFFLVLFCAARFCVAIGTDSSLIFFIFFTVAVGIFYCLLGISSVVHPFCYVLFDCSPLFRLRHSQFWSRVHTSLQDNHVLTDIALVVASVAIVTIIAMSSYALCTSNCLQHLRNGLLVRARIRNDRRKDLSLRQHEARFHSARRPRFSFPSVLSGSFSEEKRA